MAVAIEEEQENHWRHLTAPGEGVISYDSRDDLLVFRIKTRKYVKSIELQNYVADIDNEGFVTGIRLFDASKVLGIPRIALRNIREVAFESVAEQKVITIKLKMLCIWRNKAVRAKEEKDVQLVQNVHEHLENRSVKCLAAIA